MKTPMPVALLIGLASLCVNVHAAENSRVKAKKVTTSEKLDQLTDRQHAIVQWQEQQQRQLQEMSQRLNTTRAATTSSQGAAYSYP